MHRITQTLQEALSAGRNRIGQLVLLEQVAGAAYGVCHQEDWEAVCSQQIDHLEVFREARAARELGLFTPEGEYRFTKGEASLKSGFLLLLNDLDELRLALDYFYPAQLGLWLASQKGELRVQNLRDKLNRQTGMYRYARSISDLGAQELVQQLCGPDHKCLKKILWKLDAETALVPSRASGFDGILDGIAKEQAIPMQCQEACNFFVAECRKRAREEFQEKEAQAE